MSIDKEMQEAHEAVHGEPKDDAAFEGKEEKQLTPHEQLEAMRLYVQSMQKTAGFTNENVRDIVESVYKRFILILNYSPLSKMPEMKEVKAQFKAVLEEEMERYKDEEKV